VCVTDSNAERIASVHGDHIHEVTRLSRSVTRVRDRPSWVAPANVVLANGPEIEVFLTVTVAAVPLSWIVMPEVEKIRRCCGIFNPTYDH
jgi:hypothetical protein